MNDEDYKLIESNLKEALEHERIMNQQLMGRLDAYMDMMKMLLRVLIGESKERQ